MILYVDVKGVGADRAIHGGLVGGEVRDPASGVVGHVTHAEYIGAGEGIVQLAVEVDDASVAAYVRRRELPSGAF